jgi:FlgD Ig-like domain
MAPSFRPRIVVFLIGAALCAPVVAVGQSDDNGPAATTLPPHRFKPPVLPYGTEREEEAVIPSPNDVRVSQGFEGLAEVLIDVNPTNPDNLVVCGHSGSLGIMATYYSFDGGKTWTLVEVGYQDRMGFAIRFDPALAFDAHGNVYVAYGVLSFVGSTERTTVVVCKSTDGGRTYPQTALLWSANRVINVPGNDKWVLATGRDPVLPDQQNVYLAWTWNIRAGSSLDQQIAIARSFDGGVTFTTPLVINDDSINGIDRALTADPSVGPNGELYVSWHDFTPIENTIMVDRSFDGGETWGTDVVVATGVIRLHTPIPAAPDRGISPGPVSDVDVSGGPHDGRVYIAYCHPILLGHDIFVRYSDDQAATWSLPVRVNDDALARDQFLPWLDVGPENGNVSVVFYDTREDANNQLAKVYATVSRTGGESFAPNVAVADVASNNSVTNPYRYSGNYLEYIGVATGPCAAYAVWSDTRHQWPVNSGWLNYYFDRIPLEDTPPQIDLTLNRTVLWAPKHEMVDIHATLSLSDECTPPADIDWLLWSVSSNQPADDDGDGSTEIDIAGADLFTRDLDFELRAERSGSATDRVYTVVYAASDDWATSFDTVYVRVPHDPRVPDVPILGEQTRGRETELRDARPNPFNPSTTVTFDLAREERVRLAVFDARGQHVRTLLDEKRPPGAHRVLWDGAGDSGEAVASGVYFLRMEAGIYSATRKLVLLK